VESRVEVGAGVALSTETVGTAVAVRCVVEEVEVEAEPLESKRALEVEEETL
jgi:hypothetical protein